MAGAGELLGNGLRLASGYVADRTKSYWGLTLAGYALNLGSVPLLALARRWEVAAALLLLERTGKALRTPARDAMLSQASAQVGRGFGFGLHEAMDQIGAVTGPLLVAAALAAWGNYRLALALLAVPALLAMAALLAAFRQFPHPETLEPAAPHTNGRLPRAFWMYLAAAGLLGAGFADFPLIAYHLKATAAFSDAPIALLYALAMGVDAVAALLFGRLFDRLGLAALLPAPLFAAAGAALLFFGGWQGVILGAVFWGVALGATESIMRAAVAGFAPAGRRAFTYGVFHACYGAFWFAGSALLGAFYSRSIAMLVGTSIAFQAAATALFYRVARGERG